MELLGVEIDTKLLLNYGNILEVVLQFDSLKINKLLDVSSRKLFLYHFMRISCKKSVRFSLQKKIKKLEQDGCQVGIYMMF